MTPDQAALRADIDSLTFKLGAKRGKWGLESLEFPVAYFAIAAPKRAQGPTRFLLRVDCRSYPALAPTSQLWDGRTDTALSVDQRPMGRTGVLVAFSPWNACLYHPIDRIARDHWPNQFEELTWKPGSTIVTLLETVHGLIHNPDYLVSTAPDAAAALRRPLVA